MGSLHTMTNGKYIVRTHGCQMNEHDSERIAGLLEADGYSVAETEDEANVIVLNTCCIRENADEKLYGQLGWLKQWKEAAPNRQLVVAGCLAQKDKDLVLKKAFVRDNVNAVREFAATTGSCAAVVGFVDTVGDQLFNAAALCCDGRVVSVYHKQLLPNYSVFDEERYFAPGAAMAGTIPSGVVDIAGVTMGAGQCHRKRKQVRE